MRSEEFGPAAAKESWAARMEREAAAWRASRAERPKILNSGVQVVHRPRRGWKGKAAPAAPVSSSEPW